MERRFPENGGGLQQVVVNVRGGDRELVALLAPPVQAGDARGVSQPLTATNGGLDGSKPLCAGAREQEKVQRQVGISWPPVWWWWWWWPGWRRRRAPRRTRRRSGRRRRTRRRSGRRRWATRKRIHQPRFLLPAPHCAASVCVARALPPACSSSQGPTAEGRPMGRPSQRHRPLCSNPRYYVVQLLYSCTAGT